MHKIKQDNSENKGDEDKINKINEKHVNKTLTDEDNIKNDDNEYLDKNDHYGNYSFEDNEKNNNEKLEKSNLGNSIYQASLQDKKNILKRIFEDYCQYGDRLNKSKLNYSKFIKLIKDAGINQHIMLKEIEIIFMAFIGTTQYQEYYKNSLEKSSMNISVSLNKEINTIQSNQNLKIKFLDFEGFLQIIAEIAKKIVLSHMQNKNLDTTNVEDMNNLRETIKETLNFLINEHIIPLLKDINPNSIDKSNFDFSKLNEDINSMPPINVSSKEILKSITPFLYDIYVFYFPYEFMNSKCDENNAKDSLLKFLKDFDIFPGLISKSTILNHLKFQLESDFKPNKLYENISINLLNSKKIKSNSIKYKESKINDVSSLLYKQSIFGRYLSFFKFIRLIVSLANKGFDINLDFLTEEEKLCLFIERMNNSNGLNILKTKQFSSSITSKFLNIPPEFILSLQKKIEDRNNSNIKFTSYEIETVKLIENYRFEYYEVINIKYSTILDKIFEYFCYYCTKSNIEMISSMRYLSFEKLLKLSNIMKPIKSKDKNKINNKDKDVNKVYNDENSDLEDNILNDLDKTSNEKIIFKNKHFLSNYLLEKIIIKINRLKINTNSKNNKFIISGITYETYNEEEDNLTENKGKNILSSFIKFNQYLLALEIISKIIYPENQGISCYESLIENNLSVLYNKINNFNQNEIEIFENYYYSKSNYEEMVSLLLLEPSKLFVKKDFFRIF